MGLGRLLWLNWSHLIFVSPLEELLGEGLSEGRRVENFSESAKSQVSGILANSWVSSAVRDSTRAIEAYHAMTEEVLVAAIALSPCWSKSWSLSGGFIRLRIFASEGQSESRNGKEI